MAAAAEESWHAVGRGSGYVFKKGQRYRFQRDGFISDVFPSRAEANKAGWLQFREFREWSAKQQYLQNGAAGKPLQDTGAAQPRAVVGQKRRVADLNADSVEAQYLLGQQQQGSQLMRPAVGAAATEVSTPAGPRSKKRRPNAQAAARGRNPSRASPAAAGPMLRKQKAAAPPRQRVAPAAPAGCAPAAAAVAAAQQECVGSNCASPAGTAALGPAAAAAAAVDPSFPTSIAIWLPGSSTDSGKRLFVKFEASLGRGGFGEVHKISVKAVGPGSLSELKLHGSAAAAVRQLLVGLGTGSSARAGSRPSDSNSITMALKLAPPFHVVSGDMQQIYNHDAARYSDHTKQRMLSEFAIMQRCAASPHIVDAFVAGTVNHDGSSLPAILMEYAALGDVEQAFLANPGALDQPWGLAGQQQRLGGGAGFGAGPGQQQHVMRGLSSSITQRIVRAAALGLKDLHRMTGCMHCDIKTNNLLVFGSADDPIIKLCDMGVCKQRSNQPTYGPVSGTKDWQAPEQATAAAGALDFCLDSWGLGLLVLGLRRARRPFWWMQDIGVSPAEVAVSLAASLDKPDSLYAQEDPTQPGSALGALEVAFVRRCMGHSSKRPPPDSAP